MPRIYDSHPLGALPFDLTQGGPSTLLRMVSLSNHEFIEPRFCASHFFSDSVMQNSTKNFTYLWLGFRHEKFSLFYALVSAGLRLCQSVALWNAAAAFKTV